MDSAQAVVQQPDGQSQQAMLRILVVDDDPGVRNLLHDFLVRFGHSVTICSSGGDAIAAASMRPFDLMFVDVVMPGMNGSQVIRELHRVQSDAVLVMITGHMDSTLVDDGLQGGAFLCLAKPVELAQLTEFVRSIASAREKRREKRR